MATVKLTTTNFYQNLLSISEFYVLNKETKGVTIEINLILRPHIGFVVRRRNLMLLHLLCPLFFHSVRFRDNSELCTIPIGNIAILVFLDWSLYNLKLTVNRCQLWPTCIRSCLRIKMAAIF